MFYVVVGFRGGDLAASTRKMTEEAAQVQSGPEWRRSRVGKMFQSGNKTQKNVLSIYNGRMTTFSLLTELTLQALNTFLNSI